MGHRKVLVFFVNAVNKQWEWVALFMWDRVSMEDPRTRRVCSWAVSAGEGLATTISGISQ